MTEPTEAQWRILDVLAMGRGRHAPMAWLTPDGAVKVYRGGRKETEFDHANVCVCIKAGWVSAVPGTLRYRLTLAGRVKQIEERL